MLTKSIMSNKRLIPLATRAPYHLKKNPFNESITGIDSLNTRLLFHLLYHSDSWLLWCNHWHTYNDITSEHAYITSSIRAIGHLHFMIRVPGYTAEIQV